MCHQVSHSSLESTIKKLESENSSLMERCRVLQLDSTSHSSELEQLTTVRQELQTQLRQLTESHDTLVADKSQVSVTPHMQCKAVIDLLDAVDVGWVGLHTVTSC